MKRTVVIPCYNESRRLDVAAFEEFIDRTPDVELLFVDDGSTDDTAAVLRDLCAVSPSRVRAISLPTNCGKAEAVRRGVLKADRSGAEFIGFWDADLATPLEAIPQFCDLLDRRRDVQIVWGTRLPLMGREIERRPIRRLLGRVFSTSSSLAVGLPIRDALCGAKMFRSGPLLQTLFGKPFESRWIFDVEILARLKSVLPQMPDISVESVMFELPLDEWHEVAGSRLRPRDFLRAGVELTGLFLRTRIWPRPPVVVAPLNESVPTSIEKKKAA